MKFLFLFVLLSLPRLGNAAQAPTIDWKNRESLQFSLSDTDWKKISEKVYLFVNDRIRDPSPNESIFIVFDGTQKCAGFVEKAHIRKIIINANIRSHVDFQIILAHELTHTFRHGVQREEVYWLDEGLAKWMEWAYIGEFPTHYLTDIHAANSLVLPEHSLDCESGHREYISSYFLMLYLHNHLGGRAFVATLAQSPLTGWDAVEASAFTLKQAGVIGLDSRYLDRKSLLRHFAASLLINNPYRANYALLQLDRRFRATAQQVIRVSASERNNLQCEENQIVDEKSVRRNFEICF